MKVATLMKTINIEGLPEPFVQAIAVIVETVRKQIRTKEKPQPRVKLPVWPGKVIGRLRREDIYDDI